MNAKIRHNDEKLEVWCVGYFTMETKGYYAGFASVDNFQVYDGNDNVTDQLDASDLKDLKERYVQYCLKEIA